MAFDARDRVRLAAGTNTNFHARTYRSLDEAHADFALERQAAIDARRFDQIERADANGFCFVEAHVSARGLYSLATSKPNVQATASSARLICGGTRRKYSRPVDGSLTLTARTTRSGSPGKSIENRSPSLCLWICLAPASSRNRSMPMRSTITRRTSAFCSASACFAVSS